MRKFNTLQKDEIARFISSQIPDNGQGAFLRRVLFANDTRIDYAEAYDLACKYFPEKAAKLTADIERLEDLPATVKQIEKESGSLAAVKYLNKTYGMGLKESRDFLRSI